MDGSNDINPAFLAGQLKILGENIVYIRGKVDTIDDIITKLAVQGVQLATHKEAIDRFTPIAATLEVIKTTGMAAVKFAAWLFAGVLSIIHFVPTVYDTIYNLLHRFYDAVCNFLK